MTDKSGCRVCVHFDKRGENESGRAYGMCRAWGFSINENDGRNCAKRDVIGNEADRRGCAEGGYESWLRRGF